jgi:MerR family transcriptional regulator, thiopeptide resistance regulator
VTIRTLRYYDKIGLLKPSGRTQAGQRFYGEMDYARLQQILTLKLIGLPLDDIKNLLTTGTLALSDLLERQKRVLAQQATQLTQVVRAIEGAQQAMALAGQPDLETFIHIIKAVYMHTESDWLGQFVTSDQQQKLAADSQRGTLADQKQTGQAWQSLFQDIAAHQDRDVADPTLQNLVDRWDALMTQYAEGDPTLAAQLSSAYQQIDTLPDLSSAPDSIQAWAHQMRDAARFIEQARRAR